MTPSPFATAASTIAAGVIAASLTSYDPSGPNEWMCMSALTNLVPRGVSRRLVTVTPISATPARIGRSAGRTGRSPTPRYHGASDRPRRVRRWPRPHLGGTSSHRRQQLDQLADVLDPLSSGARGRECGGDG